MHAYILSAVLLLAPPLQAVFDLPLQLAFQLSVLGACLWRLYFFMDGSAPAPGLPRPALALASAAGLSFLALLASPFKGYIVWEWGNLAAGVLIYLYSSSLTEAERALAGRAAAAGGWLVLGAALLFFLMPGVPAPLTNLNALALFCLLLAPGALARRDWLLLAALVAGTLLCRSFGAVLAGLIAGCFWLYDTGRLRGFRFPALAGALALAAVMLLYGSESVSSRLAWWGAAWKMFLASPLTGFGYASYTWAHAGFLSGGAEFSVYAHSYYLEFLAENGLPAALAWCWFLYRAAAGLKGPQRYAVIAALAHSFLDFGLAVPANFWLFCFLLSSPAPAGAAGFVRLPRWTAAPALLLAAGLLALGLRGMAFSRAGEEAKTALAAGGLPQAEAKLAPWLSSRLYRLPALEFLGELALSAGAPAPAAAHFETALAVNPYSAGAWRALRRIYSRPGLEREAEWLERRRAEVYK